METLTGGRNSGIYREHNKIYRPSGFWSVAVQQLLLHLKKVNFQAAPEFLGFDNHGNEILSYVSGQVYNYPLQGPIASTRALISAAILLRQYHDATTLFVKSNNVKKLQWLLPSREPTQVICHGDYAPYNVALDGDNVVGIIDFDTAHPAPRLWDVAYAVYCWAPFKTDNNDKLGDLATQIKRAKLFCDSYNLANIDRLELLNTMVLRLQALLAFMFIEAKKGNQAFIANIQEQHHLGYIADIGYLKSNQHIITSALLIKEP